MTKKVKKPEVPPTEWSKYHNTILESQKKYQRNTLKSYSVRFNKNKDRLIIEHIERQGQVIPYIRKLIIKDMQEQGLPTESDEILE